MIEKPEAMFMFDDNEADSSSVEVKNTNQQIREEVELEKSDSEDDKEEDGKLHVSDPMDQAIKMRQRKTDC